MKDVDEVDQEEPRDRGPSFDAGTCDAELNEPQADAASHVDGPIVVFAGAGSGKTRVITYRIANLCAVHRVPPYRILAVTFTNKAAGEMKKRLENLIGADLAKDLWVGTFHAVCARLLRQFHDAVGLKRSFLVYDDGDQRTVMNRVVKELRIDDKRFPPRQLLASIHKAKQEAIGPDDYIPGNPFEEVVARCYKAYAQALTAANAVDFDDLLLFGLRLAESKERVGDDLRRKFRYVLVDEFQDVNQVQYRFVRALSSTHKNLCVVGDDDQSIYRWRGADVRIVRNFRHDHPGARVVKLEQNYRSTSNIVAGALGVIEPAEEREPKELWTANPPGEPIRVVGASSERDEAAFVVGRVKELLEAGVPHGEIAIFYRIHAQSRVLEEVVRAAQIPYQIVGGVRFFERAEIKDVLSYMRLIANPASDVDLERIVNVPPRRIGDTTIARLAAKARELGTSAFDAIEPLTRGDELGPQPKKALAKFHALIAELADFAKTASPSEVAAQILEASGYRAMLEADESDEAEARLFNLEEFIGSIGEYESEVAAEGEVATLPLYLERVTLTAQVDDMKDAPKIVMMTVHAAKGLEFDHVFITGMEEDMFPFRSQDPNRKNDEEEERRLAYVAVTRARKELVITHAETRAIFGTTRLGTPSGFIRDLPSGVVRQDATAQRRGGIGRNGLQGRFVDRESYAPDSGQRREGTWVHPMDRQRRDESPPSYVPGERFVVRDDESAPLFAARGAGSGWMRRSEEDRDAPATGMSGGAQRSAPVRGRSIEVRVGARVRHNQFGVGVVEDVESGQDPTATVRFPGWSSKRIKTRFLAVAD